MAGWQQPADEAIPRALADGKPRTVVQLGGAVGDAVPLDVRVRFYLKEREQRACSKGRLFSDPEPVDLEQVAMLGARRIATRRLAALRKRPSVRIEVPGPAGDRSYRLVR
jgi:hypothetical protein